MKKSYLFSLAVFAVAWMTGSSARAWDEPTQVDGVYQIGTASELEWFAEYVNSATEGNVDMLNAQAVLTADIDMKDIDHNPIGRIVINGEVSDKYKFSGKFDGQFHTISNLVIDRPDDEALGLFGFVRGNAKIKNIILDKTCSIRGKNRVGSIIGLIQTNTYTAESPDGLEILNCVSYATLTTTSGAAGMIGAGCDQYPYFDMENCVNAGTVTAVNKGSAFCGWNRSAGGNAKMWNCLNIAEIKELDTGSNGGQLFRGANRSIANCYDTFHSASNFQGEHPTYKTADPLHSGELCYLLNTALRSDLAPNANPNAHPFTQDLSDPNSIPLPIPGKAVYEVAAYNCDGTPKDGVSYSNEESGKVIPPHTYSDETGLCTYCGAPNEAFMTPEEDGFYHLSTPAQVEWFSAMVKIGHGAMKVKLDADIDFGGVADAHMPIGTNTQKYFGHFDGQGHRIKGMVLTTANSLADRDNDGQGFFGSVRGGGTDSNGTTNNEVVIENLIIDESCSVTHNKNFVAGVVGRVNSVNTGATVIIRNCGNEAAVTTSGKNAAGILGCVASTNVALKLYNLWNKGTIVGNGGESAAICAWTGQRNVNGEVDVEGCWNIGEVTGVDGNGYNLIRRNTEIVPRNIVDLCTTNGGNQGKVAVINTEDPISSGELCYLLNGDQTSIVYTQTLGTDAMPVYGTTSKQVYQAGTINCAGVAVGGLNYNNESGETIQLDHRISDEIGMCSVCHTQFQAPELVDGWYELKNAGNVEWFGQQIAGGNLTLNAKLVNDIDFLNIENLHSPIGPNAANKFNGTFDGQGYRIKNMIIERPTEDNIGFFGWLRGNNANTTVKNLIIDESCSIHAHNRVGGLTGTYQNGGNTITIENVINEATVTAEHQDAGGIFGGHDAGNPTIIIRNVMNTGTITAKNEHPYAGALCCYMGVGDGSLIENFVNLGTVNGHEGGNIGRYNIGNVKNLIDLSDTEDKTQGVVDGLTAEDVLNGKLAYTVGWGQFIGIDKIPSPFNETKVNFVGEAGYATFFDATTGYVPNGDVKANVAVLNKTWLDLTEIEVVPAETPVILKGTYYNMIAKKVPAINIANDLKGVAEDVEAAGKYVLAKPEGEAVGFYKAATGIIKAGKAYIALNANTGSLVKAFYFEGEDATGIANVNVNDNQTSIYNIAGQRVSKLQKGINIVGGKKVLF
jgi:hypothetical protein